MNKTFPTAVTPPPSMLREEWFLAVSLLTMAVFLLDGHALFADMATPIGLAVVFIWLFAVLLGAALNVVRHADHLAERLGEPWGTLILTLSVTAIEAFSISAVMLHGANNPTLVRDMLFSVVMVILNGMVGLTLLVGAWRHREQQYNLQGANSYLGLIIPLAVLSLILPDFTTTTAGPTLSLAQRIFLVLTSVSLFGGFLAIQTSRHRGYFVLAHEERAPGERFTSANSTAYHFVLLAIWMLPVIYLAEQLAHPVDDLIETLHGPAALGGLTMALLVAAPEGYDAVRAASANHLQHAVNVFMGSVLSTISLTIPVMLIVAHFTHHDIVLGLQHTDIVMLMLTLLVSVLTFASGKTNVLQGIVHLILFAAYLLLIFEG